MCLVAFALNTSARWPLVLASNRDEFFERPSLPLARWQSPSGRSIVSGRDGRAGGTWLGCSKDGRVAFLTNVREASAAHQRPAARSRGELVMRWLDGELGAGQFMAQTDSSAYDGFNLVLGDLKKNDWTWLSNRSFDVDPAGREASRPQPVQWRSQALTPGVYGLSNAALDTPWPKTLALKQALKDAIAQAQHDADRLHAPLWMALGSRQRASSAQLPDTGLPLALEQALSSALVEAPERGYGTRSSTVLLASASGYSSGQDQWKLRMEEKTHGMQPESSAANQVLEWATGGEHDQ